MEGLKQKRLKQTPWQEIGAKCRKEAFSFFHTSSWASKVPSFLFSSGHSKSHISVCPWSPSSEQLWSCVLFFPFRCCRSCRHLLWSFCHLELSDWNSAVWAEALWYCHLQTYSLLPLSGTHCVSCSLMIRGRSNLFCHQMNAKESCWHEA